MVGLAKQNLTAWLDERRRESGLQSFPLSLDSLPSWKLREGNLRHRTGRFFSIVGARARCGDPLLDGIEQPLIDQPEVGILGFLLVSGTDGPRLLVQAKAEPGNVHDAQLAPTIQATESNYLRIHGGAPTPFLDRFLRPQRTPVSDSLQSEHGSRFLAKYNRNQVVEIDADPVDPPGPNWTWVATGDLLGALVLDFTVNTDARSVLVCTDWDRLAPGDRAFVRWRGDGGWRESLWRSAHEPPDEVESSAVRAEQVLRERRRRYRIRLDRVPLETLESWRFEDGCLRPKKVDDFQVVGRRVHAPGREVTDWDQPLVRSSVEGEVVLVARMFEGTLRFLFRASPEIGFREGVQWGPTLQLPDGSPPAGPWGEWLRDRQEAAILASCLQSDEGGRFDRSVVRYCVLLAPARLDPEIEDGFWMSLAMVRRLLPRPGNFTNEARSALSLLLSEL